MSEPINAGLQSLENVKRMLEKRLEPVHQAKLEAERREGELRLQITEIENKIYALMTRRTGEL